MNTQLVSFCERVKNAPTGKLNFYTHLCHNGFKKAILEYRINGDIRAVWMSCNADETEYLINKYSYLLTTPIN